MAVQEQAATGQEQPAVTENMPKKRSIDQTRDYKNKLPLPAKKKKISALVMSANSQFDSGI